MIWKQNRSLAWLKTGFCFFRDTTQMHILAQQICPLLTMCLGYPVCLTEVMSSTMINLKMTIIYELESDFLLPSVPCIFLRFRLLRPKHPMMLWMRRDRKVLLYISHTLLIPLSLPGTGEKSALCCALHTNYSHLTTSAGQTSFTSPKECTNSGSRTLPD